MATSNLNILNYAKGELEPAELSQFMMTFQSQQKTTSTGVLLALLLGGFGAHKFWNNETGAGVIYLLCGTLGWFIVVPPIIIAIMCIVDACQMSKTVERANLSCARQLVEEFKILR